MCIHIHTYVDTHVLLLKFVFVYPHMYVSLCIHMCVRVFVFCVRVHAHVCVMRVCARVGLSQEYAIDIQIHPKYIPP